MGFTVPKELLASIILVDSKPNEKTSAKLASLNLLDQNSSSLH